MKTIALRGKSNLDMKVDDEDYDMMVAVPWYYNTKLHCAMTVGSSYAHRVVLGLHQGDPRTVRHINKNRLDNRRENLVAELRD